MNFVQKMVLKGCFSMTLGKDLHVHCSGLPADRSDCVRIIDLLGRLSCKGC